MTKSAYFRTIEEEKYSLFLQPSLREDLMKEPNARQRRFVMKRIMSLLSTVVCLLLAGALVTHAVEHHSAPYKGTPEFERVKQLVGVWEGSSDMGKTGDKIKVEYRLTSGGSALVETLAPGNGEEMVSVYYDLKGKLAMTHYCSLHNRPLMTLAKSDDKAIELVFAKKGNDINPSKEMHMHGVSFTFTDNDHIVQKWAMFDKGKKVQDVEFTLTRVH
jgi:hypothetical protein